jgi:hypothetical protein
VRGREERIHVEDDEEGRWRDCLIRCYIPDLQLEEYTSIEPLQGMIDWCVLTRIFFHDFFLQIEG